MSTLTLLPLINALMPSLALRSMVHSPILPMYFIFGIFSSRWKNVCSERIHFSKQNTSSSRQGCSLNRSTMNSSFTSPWYVNGVKQNICSLGHPDTKNFSSSPEIRFSFITHYATENIFVIPE